MDWTLKRLRRGRAGTDHDAEAKQRAISRWEGEGGSSIPSRVVPRTQETAPDGSLRTELTREIERLEAEVRAGIDALGHEVYPLIEAGSPALDAPTVKQQLAVIAAAQEKLRAAKSEAAK